MSEAFANNNLGTLSTFLDRSENSVSKRFPSLVKSFLSDKNVASIAPSSTFVQRAICAEINFSVADTIVEFGAGNGAITNALLRLMKPVAQLIAFETNNELALGLSEKISDKRLKIIHASAEISEAVCQWNGVKADVIVSGIPFSFLSDRKALEIIDSARQSLSEDGTFILYQSYLPPFYTSRRLRRLLGQTFKNISTRKIPLNLPPLEILICKV